MWSSLKQLQKAFEQSPFKSIDYFLEILLLAKRTDSNLSTGSGTMINSDAFKNDSMLKRPDRKAEVTPVKIETTGGVLSSVPMTPSPMKPVTIRIQNDLTPSPEGSNKRSLTAKDQKMTPKNSKMRKLPVSVTIDVVKPDSDALANGTCLKERDCLNIVRFRGRQIVQVFAAFGEKSNGPFETAETG